MTKLHNAQEYFQKCCHVLGQSFMGVKHNGPEHFYEQIFHEKEQIIRCLWYNTNTAQ